METTTNYTVLVLGVVSVELSGHDRIGQAYDAGADYLRANPGVRVQIRRNGDGHVYNVALPIRG